MKHTKNHFILDFQNKEYPYFEEINEGILNQLKTLTHHATFLNVGAGRCRLGEVLCKLGHEVYAVEYNEVVAKEAEKKVNKVICVDLHDIEKINQSLQDKKFDYIIFSDVLEHVYDPLLVLRNYRSYLATNGKFIISLPNVANWLNRFRFMLGIFNYEMTGVMDRTHIRFFTRKTAKSLIKASGCRVEKIDYTPFIIRAFLPVIKWMFNKNKTIEPKSIIVSPFYSYYMNYIYPIEYWITRLLPSLFSFRIILIAQKD